MFTSSCYRVFQTSLVPQHAITVFCRRDTVGFATFHIFRRSRHDYFFTFLLIDRGLNECRCLSFRRVGRPGRVGRSLCVDSLPSREFPGLIISLQRCDQVLCLLWRCWRAWCRRPFRPFFVHQEVVCVLFITSTSDGMDVGSNTILMLVTAQRGALQCRLICTCR